MARRPVNKTRAGRGGTTGNQPKPKPPKIGAIFVNPERYNALRRTALNMPHLLEGHYGITGDHVAEIPDSIRARKKKAWAVWKAMIATRTPRMILTGEIDMLSARRLDKGNPNIGYIDLSTRNRNLHEERSYSGLIGFLEKLKKQGVEDVVLIGGERSRDLRRIINEVVIKKLGMRAHVVFDASATHEVSEVKSNDRRTHMRDKRRFRKQLHKIGSGLVSSPRDIRRFREGLSRTPH